MIASEAISRIQNKLGYRTDKADEILQELQDAQHTLENGVPSPEGKGATYTPWFLTTEVASALTQTDEERLLLPTDFLREVEDCKVYLYDATAEEDERWRLLEKNDEAFLKAKYPGGGEPKAYYLSNGYFRFRPVPDDAYTIKVIYGGRDTTLTSGITNKWLTHAPWVLIGAAGMSMAQSLRDATALQFFQQRFSADNVALYQLTLAREVTNDRPVMGGET